MKYWLQKIFGIETPLYAIVIVVAAIATIRLVPLLYWKSDLQLDPDAYAALAEGWAGSGTFGRYTTEDVLRPIVLPTAYRPPLYPWLLKFLVTESAGSLESPFLLHRNAVATFHWFLGVLTCLGAIRITACCTNSKPSSISGPTRHTKCSLWLIPALVGLAVACDPILIRQSSLIMTETLATFLAVAFWLWWCHLFFRETKVRKRAFVVAGILMSLSIFCRPAAAVWAILVFFLLLLNSRTTHDVKRFRLTKQILMPVLFLATISCMLMPWALRNYLTFGKPIWATTHGGYTLLLANNPILFEHYQREGMGRQWEEQRFHKYWQGRDRADKTVDNIWTDYEVPFPAIMFLGSVERTEIEDDDFARQAAWWTIRNNPETFYKACLIRIAWLWHPWPAANQANRLQQIAIGGWYISLYMIIFIFACWNLVQRRRLDGAWLLVPGFTLIIALTAVHAVYWSNMRMRSVAMPAMYIFAGYLVHRWLMSRPLKTCVQGSPDESRV